MNVGIKLGVPVTVDNIVRVLNEETNDKPFDATHIRRGLMAFMKRGLLTSSSEFQHYANSSIKLTPLGERVVTALLLPILAWCNNQREVKEIVEISNRLQTNPNAYQYLYARIADSYIATSPFKKDREVIRTKVKEFLRSQPQSQTVSEIADKTGESENMVNKITKELILEGFASKSLAGTVTKISLNSEREFEKLT